MRIEFTVKEKEVVLDALKIYRSASDLAAENLGETGVPEIVTRLESNALLATELIRKVEDGK